MWPVSRLQKDSSPQASLGNPQSASLFLFLSHKHAFYPSSLLVHDTAVPPMGPKYQCLGLDLLIAPLYTNFHRSTYKPTPVFPGCWKVRKVSLSVVWSLFIICIHSVINCRMCTWLWTLSQGARCLAEEIDTSCQNFLFWQVVRPQLTGACFSQGRLEVPLWEVPQAEGNSKCKGPVLYPVPCPHPLPPGPPPALPLLSPGLQCPSPHQSYLPLVLWKHCGSKPGTSCPSLSGPLTTSISAHVKRAQAVFNPHCSQSDCHPHLSSSLTLSSSLYSPAPSMWCFLLFLVSLTFIEIPYHTIHLFHVYKSLVFSLFTVVQPSQWSKFTTLSSPKKKPHFVGCLFSSMVVSFVAQKFFSEVQFIYFFFCASGVISKKPLPHP